MRLANIEGSVHNNVIPSTSSAKIRVDPVDQDELTELVEKPTETYNTEYQVADPDPSIEVAEPTDAREKVFFAETSDQLLKLIHLIPNGLLSINRLVDADKSFNELMESTGSFPTGMDNTLGILRTEDDQISITTTITSALNSEKCKLVNKLEIIVELVGAGAEIKKVWCGRSSVPV